MRPWVVGVGSVLAGTIALTSPAAAQQRPLVTEDPETVAAGQILLEGGVQVASEQEYRASGLEGTLVSVPALGVSVGLGSMAELQLDWSMYNRLSIKNRDPLAPLAGLVTATGSSTGDVGDVAIGTKIRLARETQGRPAFGFRFATSLPNASNESGLGLDTTNFFASILAAKTVESLRVVGNVGLGILPDPTEGNRQNDVLTYGVSFARAMTPQAELVGEINGRVSTRSGDPFPGTETRSTLLLGGRYTRGSTRLDAAVYFGLTTADPTIGFTGGVTYVFNAFTVP